MPQSRRRLLAVFVGTAGVFATKSFLGSALPAQRTPQPLPSPNAPNQNFPPGLDGPDNKLPSDRKQVDPQKLEEIRTDIQKLYDLASELKDQTGKADLSSTLPVSVVKKAQQIEKLAKQIRELSKG